MSDAVYIEPSKRVTTIAVTCPKGLQPSNVVNLRQYAIRGVIVPAGWAGTALTFKASPTEVTDAGLITTPGLVLPVYDDAGSLVTVTIAASRYVVFGTEVAEKLNALGNFIVIVNNATQAADSTLTLVCVASTK